MALSHWFIPHKETHQKAHLISWHGLVIYLLLFILLQVGFSLVGQYKPGILGTASNIDQEQVIKLTNDERIKDGLAPLQENAALDAAAKQKAADMFQENYWAHFSPTGKSPWDFILGSGYKFTFAGENLAKSFYKSSDVVSAWMASPSHRENILNPQYHDIGLAVVEGTLNGQKTTLVVQMFGTTETESVAAAPVVDSGGQKTTLTANQYDSTVPVIASAFESNTTKSFFDPYQLSKAFGIGVFGLIGGLLVVDFIVLRRRGVFRFSSHHVAHLALLSTGIGAMLTIKPGVIL